MFIVYLYINSIESSVVAIAPFTERKFNTNLYWSCFDKRVHPTIRFVSSRLCVCLYLKTKMSVIERIYNKIPKERFIRARDKIYAAVVNEDIPAGFRSYIFVMRVTGLWPTANDFWWYKWLSVTYFLFAGLLNPITLFVNIFYVNSVLDIVMHVNTSLTSWIITMRMGVLYWRNDSIREIFSIHSRLSRSAGRNPAQYDRIARLNYRLHVILTSFFMLIVVAAVIQTIDVKPEDGIIPSSSLYPFEVSNHRVLYVTLLVYQIWGGTVVTMSNVVDALNIAVINVLCDYLNELKLGLTMLGSECAAGEDRDTQFYRDLRKCCIDYEDCWKYEHNHIDKRGRMCFGEIEKKLFSASLV